MLIIFTFRTTYVPDTGIFSNYEIKCLFAYDIIIDRNLLSKETRKIQDDPKISADIYRAGDHVTIVYDNIV